MRWAMATAGAVLLVSGVMAVSVVDVLEVVEVDEQQPHEPGGPTLGGPEAGGGRVQLVDEPAPVGGAASGQRAVSTTNWFSSIGIASAHRVASGSSGSASEPVGQAIQSPLIRTAAAASRRSRPVLRLAHGVGDDTQDLVEVESRRQPAPERRRPEQHRSVFGLAAAVPVRIDLGDQLIGEISDRQRDEEHDGQPLGDGRGGDARCRDQVGRGVSTGEDEPARAGADHATGSPLRSRATRARPNRPSPCWCARVVLGARRCTRRR